MLPDFLLAIRMTIPILMGYFPVAIAFGIIVLSIGYPWYVVGLMSLLVYAGASQFAAIAMFSKGESLFNILFSITMINIRHIFYGISLIDAFNRIGAVKPYLIFGLTDEVYGLLTAVDFNEKKYNKKNVYFFITLLSHFYWIVGGLVGYFIGNSISYNFSGIDFALTALFIVLMLDQWKISTSSLPFIFAILSSALSLILFKGEHFILTSFIFNIILLLLFREKEYRC